MGLSERLRRETRDAHEAIEAAFGLDRWLASRDAYADLLGRLHAFHRSVARGAVPHLAETGLARLPDRTAHLESDLVALGASRRAESENPNVVPPTDRAEAAGAVYVLEGSALGGLLIAREIDAKLGIGPENGGRYFAGEGRDTMRRWREVQAAIDALASPGDDGRTVAAANRTFAAMQETLSTPVSATSA